MSHPIKVCHFTSVHKSDDVRIFLKECVSLAAAGFDVTLVAPNCATAEVNGVKIIGVPVTGKGRLLRIISTSGKIAKAALAVNADIYHFHDPELLLHALKIKRKHKKVIYDAHEDLPKQIRGKFWINSMLRPIIATVVKWFEDYVAARMDHVITATPMIRERFKKINSSCTDINNFPLEKELASETAWTQKANEVCYIGSISRIRGVEQLVNAMEHVSTAKMNIAGNYHPENLHTQLKSMREWDKIIDHGYVDRKKAARIMARSKAGIVTFLANPNHVDAQPNKMFEYMSAGIPVIGSNFPLWREIIEGNRCGICVDPQNPQKIADAINYITANDTEAEQMGKNGRKAVLEKYNWKVEEKKLINIYTNLCPQK